jgi:hypothetical protein
MDNYKVNIPEGKINDWTIEKITVTEKQARHDMLRSWLNGHDRCTPAGEYTVLKHKNEIVMSDTPDEINDHLSLIQKAKGNILISGLGLGMVLKAIIDKTNVKHVTIVEKNKEVIDLVGKHYLKKYPDKLTIVHDDIFTFNPPENTHYDVIWHDIWYTICEDNLEQIVQLHCKYDAFCDWQDSWSRILCENNRKTPDNTTEIHEKVRELAKYGIIDNENIKI